MAQKIVELSAPADPTFARSVRMLILLFCAR